MFKLEIVKVKGNCKWAIKATVEGISRYRGYYYKKEALRNMDTWSQCGFDYFKYREFMHNFHTAEELGLEELS